MKNYYKVLNIEKTALPEEINKAYHSLAQKYNPETNKGDIYATQMFIDISIAYKTLRNRDKRKDYDRVLQSLGLDNTYESAIVPQSKDNGRKVFSNTLGVIAALITVIACITG